MKDHIRKAAKFLKSAPIIGGLFEKHPKVITIRFSGVIADNSMKRGGISYAKYASLLDKAFDKHEISAVALIINSPGGAPAQTSLIANHIRRLSEEKDLPVYAFVEDVAASGGYWLACAADEIYAQSTSIVGSIGVISASFGFEDFIAKHDIHRRVHTSGKEKSFMDPFTPESKADLERLKSIQKDIPTKISFLLHAKTLGGFLCKRKNLQRPLASIYLARTLQAFIQFLSRLKTNSVTIESVKKEKIR